MGEKVEVIKDRLYWTCIRTAPVESKDSHFFCTDDTLTYDPYYSDFGPLNTACVCRYCRLLTAKLNDPSLANKVIFHCCRQSADTRANSVFLICTWLQLCQGKTPEEAFRPVDQLLDFFLGEPNPRAHVHGFVQGDLVGPFGQLGGVRFFQKGKDGLVQVLHGEVAQLHGPAQGHCGIRFGDGHLVVGVIGPAPPEIGLEEEFSLVGNEQAVGLAAFRVFRRLGQFAGILQDELFPAAVHAKRSYR